MRNLLALALILIPSVTIAEAPVGPCLECECKTWPYWRIQTATNIIHRAYDHQTAVPPTAPIIPFNQAFCPTQVHSVYAPSCTGDRCITQDGLINEFIMLPGEDLCLQLVLNNDDRQVEQPGPIGGFNVQLKRTFCLDTSSN